MRHRHHCISIRHHNNFPASHMERKHVYVRMSLSLIFASIFLFCLKKIVPNPLCFQFSPSCHLQGEEVPGCVVLSGCWVQPQLAHGGSRGTQQQPGLTRLRTSGMEVCILSKRQPLIAQLYACGSGNEKPFIGILII